MISSETVLGLILAHLVGDYVLQSHWMATQKTERWWPAVVHGVVYTLPFLLVTQSPIALTVIAFTHIVIDHYRLAKHVSWLKNLVGPRRYRPKFSDAMSNGGYDPSTPVWLSTWLMIITDNSLHMIINAVSVIFL